MEYKELISYDALYESYLKCRRGVNWKPCVRSFDLNAPQRILKMNEELENGTWKNGTPRPILITYPKRREGLSIPFRDRVYQRSINDNLLYPLMSKSFIHENSACQIGKGPEHAREICKRNLRREFINNGLDFYVLQIDIHHYYQTIPHAEAEALFKDKLDEQTYKAVCEVLRSQNSSDVGYNPGSQMIQIVGISMLNGVDHYCKEQLHLKDYQRYMDDFLASHSDREYLQACLEKIVAKLENLGFEINPEKTHVTAVKDGFRFLGYDYRLTRTGQIVMTIPSDKVEHERRKLKREVILWSQGKMKKSKIYDGLQSWESAHSAGNTHKVFVRMEQYLKGLWKEYGNEVQKVENEHPR